MSKLQRARAWLRALTERCACARALRRLNEGFTVYIERLILGEVHKSNAVRDFESLIGE